MKKQLPRVGVGVLVFKNGKLLLHRRKNGVGIGSGEYSAIGGHLEYMESFADGVRREAREEAGIEIKNIRFLCVSNTRACRPKHYIDISLSAEWKSGVPKILEPKKCAGWDWYDINNLPKNLFISMFAAIEAYKTGRNFFDA